jgi:hypothetical protein
LSFRGAEQVGRQCPSITQLHKDQRRNQTTLRYDPLIENHIDPLRYAVLIEKHLEHLKQEYGHLNSMPHSCRPQFYFITATFVPVEAKRADHIPIPPHRCITLFEQFYVRLLSKLMNNFERKRSLQPLTYVYIDYPFTKQNKTFATLPSTEQFRVNQFHYHPDHPETTSHIHGIMLVAPSLVDRFNAIAPELELLFQKLGAANRTLHCVPISLDELRDVMFYSSKLLKQPSSVLRGLSKKYWEPRKIPDEARTSVCDIDLYSLLPRAKSEPIYVKSDWERVELAEIKEAKRFKGLKQAMFGSIEAGTIVRSKTDLQP